MTIDSDDASDLAHAYLATAYVVHEDSGDLVLRIGQRSSELEGLLAATQQTTATFITACAPFSQTREAAEDIADQNRLEQALRDITEFVFPAEGRSVAGDWPAEPSFLALGLSFAQACALGRQFRQNAVLFLEEEPTPRLVVLRNLAEPAPDGLAP